MLREYSRTKFESFVQIRTTVAEIQKFSLGECFIGTPCVLSKFNMESTGAECGEKCIY